MIWFSKSLTYLPDPPTDVLQSVDLSFWPQWNQTNNSVSDRFLTHWQGKSGPAAANKRVNSDVFDVWVRDNIASEIVNCGITYTTLDTDQVPCTSGAHTDTERQAALIYNLVPGGDKVSTVFWQEHGQELVRPNRTWVLDDRNLTQVHSLVIPSRTWTLINTTVLHSVENLFSGRVSLQVGLSHQQLDQIWAG